MTLKGIGMPTLIEHKSIQESAQLCQELGLEFVELNMNLPQYQIEKLEQISELKKIADTYQVYYTIHLDENMNICDFNRAVTNAYLDTVKRTINVAKQLEIPVLNMHMNHGVHFTLPDRKVQLYQQYNHNYMEDIKWFRKMCEDTIGISDIKISIENTDGYYEYEKTAIEYLLESEVFSLTWDIGHSYAAGGIDEPFFMLNEEKIGHFHIHDAIKNQNHLTLGSGEIDLNHKLSIACKNDCRCVVETKTIKALEESSVWLKRLEKENYY